MIVNSVNKIADVSLKSMDESVKDKKAADSKPVKRKIGIKPKKYKLPIHVSEWTHKPFLSLPKVPNSYLRLDSMLSEEISGRPTFANFYLSGVAFVWCIKGKLRFSFSDAKPITISTGEFMIIYPDRYLSMAALDPTNIFTRGIISGDASMSFMDELGFCDLMVLRDVCSPVKTKILSETLANARKGNAADNTSVMRITWKMLFDVLERNRDYNGSRFFDVIRGINWNFARNVFAIKDIAADLGISVNSLQLFFRQNKYPHPGDFVKNRQIRRAVALLTRSDKPIPEIAKMCGMSRTSQFNAFIVKHCGKSPSSFRPPPHCNI